MNNLPVLIVGAGPTGLMMACELARHGISFRIIDKKSECTQASNATWIQPRTLELFDQIGIVDRFTKIGHACNAINFYIDGKHSATLSLKQIDSIYPYILMLPQSKTEKILEDYLLELNKKVERSLELIDIKLDNHQLTSTVKYVDGQIENIKSDWLIACDGANSLIRERCGFHFPGEDFSEQFMVADATVDFSYLPKDELHFFFDAGTVLTAFPLGSNKYRLAANLHLDHPRKFFTEREVIETVQERAHGNYYVTNVAWISPFWIHGKLIEHMRKGPIFLAGDAAHIHSPAAGQGMNMGIQDASNLAWKLALVIKNEAKPSLLDSYEIERYSVAKETVEQNEYFTNMAIFDNDFLSKLKIFGEKLSADSNQNLAKQIGNKIGQVDIQYKHSPVINDNDNKNLLQPGKRLPDIFINQKTIYQHLNNNKHNLLLFTGLNPVEDELRMMDKIQKHLENKSNLLNVYIICKEQVNFLRNTIIDINIHRQFQINKPTILIIRPDTYIAYFSENLSIESINDFLNIYLNV